MDASWPDFAFRNAVRLSLAFANCRESPSGSAGGAKLPSPETILLKDLLQCDYMSVHPSSYVCKPEFSA